MSQERNNTPVPLRGKDFQYEERERRPQSAPARIENQELVGRRKTVGKAFSSVPACLVPTQAWAPMFDLDGSQEGLDTFPGVYDAFEEGVCADLNNSLSSCPSIEDDSHHRDIESRPGSQSAAAQGNDSKATTKCSALSIRQRLLDVRSWIVNSAVPPQAPGASFPRVRSLGQDGTPPRAPLDSFGSGRGEFVACGPGQLRTSFGAQRGSNGTVPLIGATPVGASPAIARILDARAWSVRREALGEGIRQGTLPPIAPSAAPGRGARVPAHSSAETIFPHPPLRGRAQQGGAQFVHRELGRKENRTSQNEL